MARIINQLPLTSNNIWFYPGAPGTKGLRFPCAGNLCFISCENAGRKRGNYADIFTGKTRGWNTGCSGENQNLHKVMQRHLRKQSKVILVTKDKGKCVFPSRRIMPRKEAAANFSCPLVYHIENLPDEKSETLVKDLVQRFAAYGATTGTEEMDEGKISYAFLTQEIARKYFAPRLQTLKDMIPDMTVDDLIDNGYKIKQLVEDPYGDAVYWNGSFYTLDYFMRNVGNAKVYFGNVLYMN